MDSPYQTNTTLAENETQGFEDEVVESGQRMLFSVIPSWMISFIGHVALIVLLAFLVMPERKEITTALEASATPGETIETIDLDVADFDESNEEELSDTEFDDVMPVEIDTMTELESIETMETSEFVSAEEMIFEDGDFGEVGAVSGEGNELGGRAGAGKKQALKEFGGTEASEEAVQLALKWIVKHQLPDGGWNLDHRIGPGDHRDSPNPGTLSEARNAATALALLPLLGNGNTHKVGAYKDSVRAGLEFLMSNAQKGGRGVSFIERGGTTYSHGLCSVTLCEAYAMSKDPKLAPFAQGVIWFTEDLQESAGGWKYARPLRGPTLPVASWQVMALKSAKLSQLDINPNTWRLVGKYLSNVSNVEGTRYGYDKKPGRSKRLSLTAMGILCRMYMGWEKDRMKEGIVALDKKGPDLFDGGDDSVDMYYNYYASQVMRQYGGEEWDRWNDKLRDNLVESQSKEGNTAGSWHFSTAAPYDDTAKKAGRLYTTALACMTLEVYYRYLPIYTDKSTTDDFKLE